MNRHDALDEVLAWQYAERSYVMDKWGIERPEIDAELAADNGTRFRHDVEMYLHRAQVLGLDNPLGRQALMKGLSTLIEFNVSVRLVFGEFPKPGVPSGELSE